MSLHMLFSSAWKGYPHVYLKLLLSLLDPNQTFCEILTHYLQEELSVLNYVPTTNIESPFWCLAYFMAVFVYKSWPFISLHIPCWQIPQQVS